jgi:Ca2+-binding RTX toxin-like protein
MTMNPRQFLRRLRPWLGGARNARHSRAKGYQPRLDCLESRDLLSHYLVIDFNGATQAELEQALRSIPTWRAPTAAATMDRRSFVDEFAALQTQYGGYNRFSWLDFNGDGTLDRQDGDLAAQAILAKVDERFLGFDLNVVREDNTSRALALMNNGVGGDTLIFAWGWHGAAQDPVGGGGGQAPLDPNNAHDDVGEVGGSVEIARWYAYHGWTGARAREAFLNQTANFIAHEAGHTFGLAHIDTTRHPEAVASDLMVPFMGPEELRFRDVALTVDGGGTQNARQHLFNVLGPRPPVTLTQFNALPFPTAVFRVTGDSKRTTLNDRITLGVDGSNLVVDVNGAVARLPLVLVRSLTIDAGDGDDVIDIQSTGGKPVTVNAGQGNDTINVGRGAGFLDGIRVTVNGQGGSDRLIVNNAGWAGGDTHEITATTVSLPRSQGLIVTYGTIENLVLNTGAGPDVINVRATAPGTATTVNAGAGDDTITVGSQLNRLEWGGDLTVDGQAGTDVLTVNDQGTLTSETYTFLAATLSRTSFGAPGGVPTISYFGLEGLQLNCGAGNDTIKVRNTVPWTTTTINAGGGSDTLIGPDAAIAWQITGPNAGTFQAAPANPVAFRDAENLVGGALADRFAFTESGRLSGRLSGGAGTDTLDYSQFATAVRVNLAAGTATAVAGGVGGIENVTGGWGNDELIGDGLANVLLGGWGMDTLHGGAGNDVLDGGADLSVDLLYGDGGDDVFVQYTPGVSVAATPLGVRRLWAVGDTLADFGRDAGDRIDARSVLITLLQVVR